MGTRNGGAGGKGSSAIPGGKVRVGNTQAKPRVPGGFGPPGALRDINRRPYQYYTQTPAEAKHYAEVNAYAYPIPYSPAEFRTAQGIVSRLADEYPGDPTPEDPRQVAFGRIATHADTMVNQAQMSALGHALEEENYHSEAQYVWERMYTLHVQGPSGPTQDRQPGGLTGLGATGPAPRGGAALQIWQRDHRGE